MQNVRSECEFPAYCEALHAKARNGAENPPGENYVIFSTHGFYCQKAVNHFV